MQPDRLQHDRTVVSVINPAVLFRNLRLNGFSDPRKEKFGEHFKRAIS